MLKCNSHHLDVMVFALTESDDMKMKLINKRNDALYKKTVLNYNNIA